MQQYFKDVMTSTEISISNIERLLWHLLTSMWGRKIELLNEPYTFKKDSYIYCLSSRNSSSIAIDFNLYSDLGEQLIEETRKIILTEGHIDFDITNYPYKLTKVSELKGRKGVISLNKITIESFENEEYLVFNGILDDGTRLSSDICELLFRLDTTEYDEIFASRDMLNQLERDSEVNAQAVLNESQMRNNKYLAEEIEKINAWADDKIQSVQLNVENMRAQRKDLASNMEEKEKIEEEIVKLSKKIKQSWLHLAMAEEDVENDRKEMIAAIKKENSKNTFVENIFTVSFLVK